MLRVPDIPPETTATETPYPENHPLVRPADHFIPVGDERDPFARYGAILAGPPAAGETDTPKNPRLEAVRRRNAFFDDANVRNALTVLHERGEEFAAGLEDVEDREIGTLGTLAESFLREQERALTAELPNERQKRMFAHCFGAFAAGITARAAAVQERRTREYREAVAARQNRAFLAMALRPENLFDDQLQTRLRDMVLLNIDALADTDDGADRAARLDATHRQFVQNILDRRLEKNPARMRDMLGAPAVRRVLGDASTRRYEELAATAIRLDASKALAREWCEAGLDPTAAKEAAGKIRDNGDRKEALAQYHVLRTMASRDLAAQNAAALEPVWREVMTPGGVGRQRLDELRRGDPDLGGLLADALDRAEANGGQPRPGDCALLLESLDNFEPAAAAETLRHPQRLLERMGSLGGADAEAYGVYMRMFFGTATREDRALLEDLRLVRALCEKRLGKDMPHDDLAAFLQTAIDAMRLQARRHGVAELSLEEKKRVIAAIVPEAAAETGASEDDTDTMEPSPEAEDAPAFVDG